MERHTDAELRPYGYAPGKSKRWCVACDTEKKGLGPKAFKCRPCAEYQAKEVDRLCRSAGYEFGDEQEQAA